MSKVLIVGSSYFYEELFSEITQIESDVDVLLESPSELDLVVFTGGADVHPAFYDGVHNGTSMVNYNRDVYEQVVFEWCRDHNIRMTGICRGFQFLNVMCDGFMYQHIDRHGIAGTHPVLFPKTGDEINVTSTHHQLVGLNENSIPMAWAHPKRSSIYLGPRANVVDAPEHEIEAAIFPKYRSMGVQFHPEMMLDGTEGREFYLALVSDFLNLDMEKFINKYGVTEQCQKVTQVQN